MNIYKFGGASVGDAAGVQNVRSVLESQHFDKGMIVVSAMGKTTNALENVVAHYFDNTGYEAATEVIKEQHLGICRELLPGNDSVCDGVSSIFNGVNDFLKTNLQPDYNFVYDQVVSAGEMASSIILSAYLHENGFENTWLDARDFIKTDSNYREGNVNWHRTEKKIAQLREGGLFVTQGFIGAEEKGNTVTLGREGSDYSAAIFAFALDAETMTIWKDVPGVMTGDPRKFREVALLPHISYEEAIEMAYYGASVIHPKTLQPLKQKNIPFFVKSFLEPQKPGTRIGPAGDERPQETFILKENQHLMHISTRDFSFIAEEHLSQIFALLARHKVKISLMQNSAISLALCVEDKYGAADDLLQELRLNFAAEVVKGVSLFTVRNANLEDLNKFYDGKRILLEQISRNTLQVVTN